MPYIVRDEKTGAITRASARPIMGAETVPHDHPDLVIFITENGQDQGAIESALTDLRRTDADMSRAVEDVVMALLKKNVLKMSDLPKPVQEKMALRVKLRVMIQEAYDRASGQQNNNAISMANNLPPSTVLGLAANATETTSSFSLLQD